MFGYVKKITNLCLLFSIGTNLALAAPIKILSNSNHAYDTIINTINQLVGPGHIGTDFIVHRTSLDDSPSDISAATNTSAQYYDHNKILVPSQAPYQIYNSSRSGYSGDSPFVYDSYASYDLAHNFAYKPFGVLERSTFPPAFHIAPGFVHPTSPAHSPSGYGVEWRLDQTFFYSPSPSDLTASNTAMVSVLRYFHPTWNWFDVKAALRQTGTNWLTGYNKDTYGFGLVNYNNANALTDDQILLQPPVAFVQTNGSNQQVTSTVLPFRQTRRVKEVLFQFPTNPGFQPDELTLAGIQSLGGIKISENTGITSKTVTLPSVFTNAFLVWFTADNATDSIANFSRIDTYSVIGPVSQNGLVGHWKFNAIGGTNAANSSASLNAGILENGSFYTAGQIGNGIQFDGQDDKVTIPAIPAYDTNSFSTSFWVNPLVLKPGNAFQNIVMGREIYLSQGFRFGINTSGTVSFWTTQSGGTLVLTSSVTIPTNKFSHVTVTYNGTVGSMYINGSLVATGSGVYIPAFGIPLTINGGPGGTRGSNSIMDDIRWYNRTLNTAEVSELARTGFDGLMGHWKLDETNSPIVEDSSGFFNNGILVNSPLSVTGKIGHGLQFDGISQKITMPLNNDFNTNTFTTSFWIKPIALKPGGPTSNIVMGREIYLSQGFRFGISTNGEVSFWTTQSGGTLSLTSTVPIQVNTFSHVVVTYNGTVGSIYINGVKRGSATGTYLPALSTPITINGGPGGTQPSSSVLDEVRWYNRALTDLEVSALTSAEISGGLVSQWNLEEASGTAALDSSGLGHTGSLVNGPLWVAGKIGYGLLFDGLDDKLTIPSSVGYDTNSFTTSFWVKPLTLKPGNGFENIVMGREIYLSKGFRFGINNNGTVSFWTNQSGGSLSLTSTARILTNQFSHIAVTYNGTVGRMYVNGLLAATARGTYIAASGIPLTINGGPGGTRGSNSVIDDVRWYNWVLNTNDVATLAQ